MALPAVIGRTSYVTEENLRATAIALTVVTTVVVCLRTGLTIWQYRRLRWDDGWLLTAWLFSTAMTIMYLATAGPIFDFWAVIDGNKDIYPAWIRDNVTMRKVSFAANVLFYSALWSVKFSFLASYRQLIIKLPAYIRAWWILTVATSLFYFVAIILSVLGCSSPQDLVKSTGCTRPRDYQGVSASLWFAYTVDVLTDLLIMMLPLGLIRKAQIPLKQKIAIGFVVCLVAICMSVATIRIIEIGRAITMYTQPSATWLAFWGIVETAMAVVIGSSPGLYRSGKFAHKAAWSTLRSWRRAESPRNDSPLIDTVVTRSFGPSLRITAGQAHTTSRDRVEPYEPYTLSGHSQEMFDGVCSSQNVINVQTTLVVHSKSGDTDSLRGFAEASSLPLPVGWDDPSYIGYPTRALNTPR